MNKLNIVTLSAVLMASCGKDAPALQKASTRADNLLTEPWNGWSGWEAKPKGWICPLNYTSQKTADIAATQIRTEFLDKDSTLKFTRSVSKAISSEDPVDPESGGSAPAGSTTSFTITFTFMQSGATPDYTGIITVYENEYHDIVGITMTVTPSWIGIYGEFQSLSDPNKAATVRENPSGGSTILFNFDGIQKTSMGLGNLFQHANFHLNINGYITLDERNNPVWGRAYLIPTKK